MRYYLAFLAILTALCGNVLAGSITVSAAISLKESLTEIAKDYETRGGPHIDLNFGASGQLAAQIAQGAPVDAFISAGQKEMDQLAKSGSIDPATRRDICGNELVLIVPSQAAFIPASFNDLTDARIKRIAIGQPKIVPAGMYAQEVLGNLKIADAVSSKLVYGQNVRQVLDYVIRGEVDAGIVYATDAAAGQVRIAAKADPSLHSPILYPAAVVKQTTQPEDARNFLDYLHTTAARQILTAHGFIVTLPTTAPAQ